MKRIDLQFEEIHISEPIGLTLKGFDFGVGAFEMEC